MPRLLSLLVVLFAMPSLARGQDTGTATDEDAVPNTKELHRGIIPLRDYSGDLGERSNLLGEWGGSRRDLAEKGILFRGWLTPLLQSVADGGASTDTDFGASMDFWAALDLDRMGVIPGGLLVARVESDVGDSTTNAAGTVIPPHYNSSLPIAGAVDDDNLSVSSLYYTQFLGERFGAWIGRTDTHHNANTGEFAGLNPQTGNTQFMNSAFSAIPVMPASQPYVTSLGTGVFARPTEDLSLAAMVMDSRESSRVVGLDDFGKDWNAFAAVSLQHRLGELPGGQTVGFSYSWNGEYTDLDPGVPFETKENTWAAIYSGWQYLQVFDGDTSKFVNLGDGRADHRGWGVFLMAGLADEDINPVRASVAGGIGARGLLSGRPNDEVGIGYYYVDFKGDEFANLIGLESGEQGIELYYEFEVSPWCHVTPDVQVIDPGLRDSDTAVLLGLRMNMSL
jgi:porin